MQYTIATYFLYFIIIAICGWIMEVTLQLIQKHKFADRGFLIGPYCPIYGVGGLLITVFLTHLEEYPIALFCVAIVICSILEYLTSYIMEKLFNARWWDYSKNKFNINGRICLETIIPFGLLGVLLIYFINPFIFDNLTKIPKNILNIIAIVVGFIFIADNIISFKVIFNFSSTAKKFDKDNPKDSTQEISEKVKEFLKRKSFLHRRLIDAFPELTAKLKKHTEKIKQKTEGMKEEITNKANEVKEDISEKVNDIKENFSEKREEWNEKTEKVKENIKKTSKNLKKNIQKVTQQGKKMKRRKRK